MNEPLRLSFDRFALDEREARLARDGTPLAVPPKTFAVLCALARRPGELVRKEELLDGVWGHQYVSDSVLKTTISDLRTLLGDDARQPRFIETASRRGYRFIAAPQAWLPTAASGAASAISTALPPPLIGRGAVHERLRAAWAEVAAGRRRVVWIAGEAGIGKTTLIDHFVAALGGEATVAHGQCVEQHGAGEPYLPVLEALASLCRTDASLPALLRSVAPTWLLQMPWLADAADLAALRAQLAGSGSERMLRELGELLDRCTQQRPLLLVTEDLHWSDQATLRLIDHIARRRAPARLMWLASFRLAEVLSEDHPLKALRHELKLHRLADELVLDPFSEREVAEVLAARWPAVADGAALARALHAHTDGLPLFVANVIDDAIARGARPDASLFGERAALPESLAGVIEIQIERLAADDRALLEAASVCGIEFHASTLADALQRDAVEVSERCDALVRRQAWLAALAPGRAGDGRPGACWTFRHALYRQVLYQRLGATARSQMHRRVALSLERGVCADADVAPAQIALHHELGHANAAAVRHYAAAAQSALRHFAPAEAMRLTTHALALLRACPDGDERLELEVALLGPRSVAASLEHGITAPLTREAFERLDRLSELRPQAVPGLLAIGYGWSLFVGGEYARAIEIAQRKRELARSRGDRVLEVAAFNLGGASIAYRGELAQAREWLEQGIAMAAGLSERLAGELAVVDKEISLRARLSQVLAHQGCVDQAQQQIAAAAARAEVLGKPYDRRLVLIYEGLLEVQLGRAERVLPVGEALQRMATEQGLAQAEGDARWFRGWALAHRGEPERGHALILEGYAIDAAIGMWRGRSAVLGYAADALMRLGRWDEAQTQLDAAFALAARLDERIHRPDLELLRARIAVGLGDPSRAREAIGAARREAREQDARWLELAAALALCELDGATREDVAALAAVRERVVEGEALALPARADALLRTRRSRKPEEPMP